MRYHNDVGFHFKLPQTLKDDFDQIARVDRVPMTSILNQLLMEFVDDKKRLNPDRYREVKVNKKWGVGGC
jgi:hypothetical protein